MSAKWLTTLIRARKAQTDLAAQQLATARHAERLAQLRLNRADNHLEELQNGEHQADPAAFVAALVAVQSAAAARAVAAGATRTANADTARHVRNLGIAATSQFSIEELRDREQREQAEDAARTAQHELDEAAATVHRRQTRKELP